MHRFDMQVVVNGPLTLTGALGITGATTITGNTLVTGTFGVTGAVTLTGATGITGATTITGATGITGDLGLTGIMRLVPQAASISGAHALTVTRSLVVYTDPGTPASSDVTLGLTGHTQGQCVRILNMSATDEDVILLAASLVGANPITLAAKYAFTDLMFDGTEWLNVGGTAPA